MKKKYISKYTYILLLSFVFLTIGCSPPKIDVVKENMAFDTVLYQTNPRAYILDTDKSKCVSPDGLPVKNFVIMDSLLFVDTGRENGIMEILSTKDFSSKGSYINNGRGADEFSQFHLTLYTTFIKKDNILYATLFNCVNGKVYSLNIQDCLNSGKAQLNEIYKNVEIPEPTTVFWAKQLMDSTLFIRKLTDGENAQRRFLIKKRAVEEASKMKFANDFIIPQGEDFNLLSTLIATSPDGSKCVEAMIGMNYINVYSPIKGNGFTVCTESELDKFSEVLSLSKEDRKYMFADVRAYDFGFAVLKYDITDKTYQSGEDFHPSILVFNWQGKALGELKCDQNFNHFDIDVNNKKLYILDSDSRIRIYDFPIKL